MIYSQQAKKLGEKLYNEAQAALDPESRMPWSHLTLEEREPWFDRACEDLANVPDAQREPPISAPEVVPPPAEKKEAVNHPAHYGGKDNPYEALKVMLAWHGTEPVISFCVLTAEKYLARAGKKASEPDYRDWRKAAFYLEQAAALRETGKLKA